MRSVLVLCCDAGIPLYGPSGASAHLRGIARALVRAGLDVRIAVPRLSDYRGTVDDSVDIPVSVSRPRKWRWKLLFKYAERGERWDSRKLVAQAVADQGLPDLIWERYSLFCDGGMQLAAEHGIPRIVELNAPLSLERTQTYGLRDAAFARKTERDILSSADRVAAVSAWLARWVDGAGVPEERVRHVPNGVEQRTASDGRNVRDELGLNGLVLGFVGTMKPWHGLERIPEMLDAIPEATLLLIGDGPVTVEHSRVRRLGRVEPDQIGELVAAMDVGLAPYASDAPPWFCPLKILEYKAQGVPVVAADIGDCASLIGDGGEVVGSDEPDAWAAAIRRQARRPRVPSMRSWDDAVSETLEGL